MHDDDVPAALGFVQVRSADQYSEALLIHQAQDDRPQLAARQRIHTDRRFIEQHQFR